MLSLFDKGNGEIPICSLFNMLTAVEYLFKVFQK
jgi:hypothetical protein